MWSELTSRCWPRRWRRYVLLALFAVLSFALVFWWYAPRAPAWPSDEPAEGFYWSAAQYQIAFGRLREQLLVMTATGSPFEPGDLAELQLREDVLASRAKLLTEPSLTRERFGAVPGFDESARAIAQFDGKVSQWLRKSDLSAADARAALQEFDAMEAIVIRLSNAARQRELDGRTSLFESFRQRELDGLIYALVVWALLVGWLVWIVLSERSDRRLARERLDALQAEQLAKEQLRQSINTKAQFLSMVSHELRSPLQVIVSSVDLLGMEVKGSERKDAISRIRRAALMLGVQLRDLLTIARGEAGRFEISLESFEATEFVVDVAEVAAHAARGKGLKFTTSVPSSPVFVRADVQRISQILANLISNSVKYTKQGEVTLALEVPREDTGRLVFVISDTGSGLPEQAMDRLRRPLSRDEEFRPRKDGSGVGLVIVRTVLDHLGGSIDVDAQPGIGTRFVVSIPVVFEDPDEIYGDATPDGLVLVVDDQVDISASVAALVKGFGHPCHVASSGETAMRLLREHVFETAFIDLDLPEISGAELAARIRREPGPNQETYLVAITAFRPEIAGDAFDEVLVKPVEGLRVWWHLGHRSRARKEEAAAARVSQPAEL
jgi:signal transduction histidine kinase/CheY-like chemotaxis protein